MRKKNLLFILFTLGMGIGLYSCNFGNSGNVSNYQSVPAVVAYDSNGNYVLGNPPFGYLYAPELNQYNYGDCVFLQQFTIDFDNQPSTQYYTATNVLAEGVSQSPYEAKDTINMGETGEYKADTLLLTDVSGIASVYYEGKFFVGLNAKDKSPTFRLIYNTEKDEADGTKNLFLIAEPSPSGGSTSAVGAIHAFDLRSLVLMGRDTTVTTTPGTASTGVDLKYIKVNLKYLSAISDTGEPTFSSVSQNPFIIYIFK